MPAWGVLHGHWSFVDGILTVRDFSCTGQGGRDGVKIHELDFHFSQTCPRLGFGPSNRWVEYIGRYHLASVEPQEVPQTLAQRFRSIELWSLGQEETEEQVEADGEAETETLAIAFAADGFAAEAAGDSGEAESEAGEMAEKLAIAIAADGFAAEAAGDSGEAESEAGEMGFFLVPEAEAVPVPSAEGFAFLAAEAEVEGNPSVQAAGARVLVEVDRGHPVLHELQLPSSASELATLAMDGTESCRSSASSTLAKKLGFNKIPRTFTPQGAANFQ